MSERRAARRTGCVAAALRRIAACAAAIALTLAANARELKSQVTELEQIPRVHPEYPLPDEPHMLFYIERSSNSNTVIYAAHFDGDGKLDRDTPVEAYWRWYNVDGHKKPLNFIERMMAYGIKSLRHDGPNGATSFEIAALPENKLILETDKNGRPEVLMRFGDRWAKLIYVYLEVDDSGLMPDVPAMDIFGIDIETGKPLRDHITKR